MEKVERRVHLHKGVIENFSPAMERWMNKEETYEDMEKDVDNLKKLVWAQQKKIARMEIHIVESLRLINLLAHPGLGGE
jgi:polyhydroxyalkanoate synthesis regulator protein